MQKKGRCWSHDYRAPGIYLVTWRLRRGLPPLGTLAGDCRIAPGTRGSAHIRYNGTGRQVKDAIWDIPRMEPRLRVLQYSVMPDHVHIVLQVTAYLDEHPGRYIARFKARFKGIFEEGYNDQILGEDRSLRALVDYVRDNPHRLAVRMTRPEFFERRRVLHFAEPGKLSEQARQAVDAYGFEAYGNFFLLKCPLMTGVAVRRRWTEEEFRENLARWEDISRRGGILISPFISRAEKEVRDRCLELGARVIHINPRPFGPDWHKPGGADFRHCAEGRLLIVAPIRAPEALSYAYCHNLNAVAAAIAATPGLVL